MVVVLQLQHALWLIQKGEVELMLNAAFCAAGMGGRCCFEQPAQGAQKKLFVYAATGWTACLVVRSVPLS